MSSSVSHTPFDHPHPPFLFIAPWHCNSLVRPRTLSACNMESQGLVSWVGSSGHMVGRSYSQVRRFLAPAGLLRTASSSGSPVLPFQGLIGTPFILNFSHSLSTMPSHSSFILDMRRDVQEIFRTTPHHKQVMMFSATLAKEIRVTCKKFMANVCLVDLSCISPLLIYHLPAS